MLLDQRFPIDKRLVWRDREPLAQVFKVLVGNFIDELATLLLHRGVDQGGFFSGFDQAKGFIDGIAGTEDPVLWPQN